MAVSDEGQIIFWSRNTCVMVAIEKVILRAKKVEFCCQTVKFLWDCSVNCDDVSHEYTGKVASCSNSRGELVGSVSQRRENVRTSVVVVLIMLCFHKRIHQQTDFLHMKNYLLNWQASRVIQSTSQKGSKHSFPFPIGPHYIHILLYNKAHYHIIYYTYICILFSFIFCTQVPWGPQNGAWLMHSVNIVSSVLQYFVLISFAVLMEVCFIPAHLWDDGHCLLCTSIIKLVACCFTVKWNVQNRCWLVVYQLYPVLFGPCLVFGQIFEVGSDKTFWRL